MERYWHLKSMQLCFFWGRLKIVNAAVKVLGLVHTQICSKYVGRKECLLTLCFFARVYARLQAYGIYKHMSINSFYLLEYSFIPRSSRIAPLAPAAINRSISQSGKRGGGPEPQLCLNGHAELQLGLGTPPSLASCGDI